MGSTLSFLVIIITTWLFFGLRSEHVERMRHTIDGGGLWWHDELVHRQRPLQVVGGHHGGRGHHHRADCGTREGEDFNAWPARGKGPGRFECVTNGGWGVP